MNFGDITESVAAGYDQVAERYASWADAIYSPERERVTHLLLDHLPAASRVLELGCGNGEPTARILSQRLDLICVDNSGEQLDRAREAAPNATFIQGDMAALDFPSQHFKGVIALFSIIHVPCETHGRLFQSIFDWLEPGGLFAFNSGATRTHRGYEQDWLGAPMFWSHHDPETTRQLVLQAGLTIMDQRVETINEGQGPATFVWWTAMKPEESRES